MRSTLIQEEWRPVVGYAGLYDASNFGRIRSLGHWTKNWRGDCFRKGKILRQAKQTNGYLCVNLNKEGKTKMFLVHRLVYEAFNWTIPDGYVINHINEIKTDNSLWNLNLMTQKENVNWGNGIKIRSKNQSDPVLQLTYPEGKFIKEWSSIADANRYGFKQSAVCLCCIGKKPQYKGFLWRKKC